MRDLSKGWVEKKLGEICNITSSKRVFQSEYTKSGIPFYRTKEIKELANGKNVTTELFISEEKYKLIKIKFGIPIEGDILLTAIGTIGEIYIVEKDKEFYFKDGNILWLKEFKSVDIYYIKFALEKFIKQIKELSSGSTYNALPIEKLKNHKIILPPLEQQRRIAKILDRAESLRAKRREAIAQLDTLTQAIFLEMFGDPVANPKGWDMSKTLGDVAEIVSGITKGRKLNGKVVREIPYLAVVNVQDQRLDLTIIKTIEATEDEISRYKLQVNDLLLTEGGDPDKLGRGTIWNEELPECIHQNHIFRVRITLNLIHPLFLIWLIGSQRGKKYFLKQAKQTTGIATINMTQLRGFSLLIPPLELQKEFASRIEAVEKLKTSHLASLAELDALFASLQYRAFRGEL